MLKKLIFLAVVIATPAMSQEKSFSLQSPDVLVETGFIKHLLPRFSLKRGIKITIVVGNSDASFGDEGTPVFRQGDKVWHFAKTEGPHTAAFQDWLLSDVGKRTIEAFAPDGEPVFSAELTIDAPTKIAVLAGDTALGETVSLSQCGRCHVVNETNRMNAIGSTPSFMLMRGFPDWQERFETFFMRKPHPAFTQVEDVTEPFPDHLPSPIVPLEVTLDQIDAITAYVASITPADLGAPLQSQ